MSFQQSSISSEENEEYERILRQDMKSFMTISQEILQDFAKDHLGHLNIIPESLRRHFGEGANSLHFVIDTSAEDVSYHVKNPGTSELAGSRWNEIFIYKLLELLGYGPKMHAFVDDRIPGLALIATQDLKTKTQEFYTATELVEELYCYNGAYLEHICALDFLANLCGLSDIDYNPGNIGIRIQKTRFDDPLNPNISTLYGLDFPHRSKTKIFRRKIKPFIIDFQLKSYDLPYLDPIEVLRENLTQETDYESNLYKLRKPNNPDDYYRAFKRLRYGKQSSQHQHHAFLNVLASAFEYTLELANQVESLKLKYREDLRIVKDKIRNGVEEIIPLVGKTIRALSFNEFQEAIRQKKALRQALSKIGRSLLNIEKFNGLKDCLEERWTRICSHEGNH